MERFVDGYLDRSHHYEIFQNNVIISGKFNPLVRQLLGPERIVCFDSRKIISLRVEQDALYPDPLYDIKLLYSHDGELSRLVRSVDIPIRGDYLVLEKRFSAHTKSISTGKVDVEKIPLRELIPNDLRHEYMYARLEAMKQLWERLSEKEIKDYEKNVYPIYRDILTIEKAGIKIDEAYVASQLKRKDLASHEESFFKHFNGNLKNGFVKTRISPVGSKTWRLRVENGFNCMAIPHGACRKAIISRFEGGTIATFDFNAIDYRCLVKATGDAKLNEFYGGCRDFHTRTASILGEVTPELRVSTKKIAYTHIYGGSTETLQKQTLLSRAVLAERIQKLDVLFAPITDFRKRLSDQARLDGFLVTPGGHVVKVEKADHDGKIIGLFGQTYSSSIFNHAVRVVNNLLKIRQRQSQVIFTVHDEIVLDLHPDERELLVNLAGAMEVATGFVVKEKEGKSYGEATD